MNIKTIIFILIILFFLCISSAFWLDYHSLMRKENRNLKLTIKQQNEQICYMGQEIYKANKEKNRWIMDCLKLRKKI